MQSEVGRKQVPILSNAALTAVHPLRKQLLPFRPAETGLRQGGGARVVLIETVSAGAFSLAAHHLYQQPRCPVAHTAREVLLPRDVIQSLTGDIGAISQQAVGQRSVQGLAVLGQLAM